jgi:hypothetical protein
MGRWQGAKVNFSMLVGSCLDLQGFWKAAPEGPIFRDCKLQDDAVAGGRGPIGPAHSENGWRERPGFADQLESGLLQGVVRSATSEEADLR